MARPLKDGVDYFPKDTSFYEDDKVRLLRAEFGAKGMYLLDYILCDLYSKNGYYIKWDKSKCFLVSDGAGCGCSPQFVDEFIAGCVRCSFFDERVFNLFGVLTSVGIQRRFIRMLKSREIFIFIEEYFLLDISNKKDIPEGILNKVAFKKVSGTENPDKKEENPDKISDNSQSKVKESKIEESRINNNTVIVADEKNIYDFCAHELGNLSVSVRESIRGFLERGVEPEMIRLAVCEAGEYGEDRKTWRYICSILNAKVREGVFTAEGYIKSNKKWRKQKTHLGSAAKKSKFCNYDDTNYVNYTALEEGLLDSIECQNAAGEDYGDEA